MASSRGTLNGPDWRDVAQAMAEYARMWEAMPEIRVSLAGTGKHSYLCLTGALTDAKSVNGVVVRSVSASVNLRTGPAMATDGALLHLLYLLDAALYAASEGFGPKTA